MYNSNDINSPVHLVPTEKDFFAQFKSVGANVRISEFARFYNPQNIIIGDNSRIDDFVILSAGVGGIEIGCYVHIGCYVSLIGGGRIALNDYVSLSAGVRIFSESDDFSGNKMSGATLPKHLRSTKVADVIIDKFSTIGTGCTILPGVLIESNVAVGAMSLVNKSMIANQIYYGVPAVRKTFRKCNCYDLEKLIK